MAVNDDGDILERDVLPQQVEDTLKRVGGQQVVTKNSAFGNIEAQGAVSITDNYKREQRAQATGGEIPEDENGLGYQYNNTTIPQV